MCCIYFNVITLIYKLTYITVINVVGNKKILITIFMARLVKYDKRYNLFFVHITQKNYAT